MKVIVAGTREIVDRAAVWLAIDSSALSITELVSGMAPGVDLLGVEWARRRGVPVKPFPVKPGDWRMHGGYAGKRRNRQMASYVGSEGGLIAVWDGRSHGTGDMISVARDVGLQVVVHLVA